MKADVSIRKNGTLFLHNVGNENTGVGLGALAANTGEFNTAVGFGALAGSTNGFGNTAIGAGALFVDDIGSGGNTAIGNNALHFNSGNFNTAIGNEALASNTTGSLNIAIGQGAGEFLTTGDFNIVIGNPGFAGMANTIVIGDGTNQNRAYIGGIRNVTTGNANAIPVFIDSGNQLGTASSSRCYKEDIGDMGLASNGLLRLRPVTFRYKKPYADGSKPLDYGLIAEEVAEVYPDLVVNGKDGQVETVQYQKLTPMLLNEVQKLNHHTQQQDETIRQLQEQNRQLTTRLAALEALLSSRVPATSAAGQ